MQQASKAFEKEFLIKAYFVYGVAMYICFYHLISNSMLSQMQHPVFIFEQTEWFYKIYLASGIPLFITSNVIISAVCDISLLVTAIGLLLSKNRLYAIVFTLLVLNYFITYNLVTGHHYHGLIGLLIISIPFWFRGEQRFKLSWELVRYYFLYLFSSAALWKILRGSVFYQDQLSNILKQQHVTLLLQNPEGYKAHVASFLIVHTGFAHVVLIINVALQLSFAIGFFTKKFDVILFWFAIFFVAANLVVMNILSADLLILDLTLLNWSWVQTWVDKQQLFTAD